MKRTRFTDEQIIGCPAGACAACCREGASWASTRQAQNALTCAAVQASSKRSGGPFVAPNGMSEGTFYNWKAKFGGMTAAEAKRLKALEDENAKLKKLLAEQMLDLAAMKDLVSKKWQGKPLMRHWFEHNGDP